MQEAGVIQPFDVDNQSTTDSSTTPLRVHFDFDKHTPEPVFLPCIEYIFDGKPMWYIEWKILFTLFLSVFLLVFGVVGNLTTSYVLTGKQLLPKVFANYLLALVSLDLFIVFGFLVQIALSLSEFLEYPLSGHTKQLDIFFVILWRISIHSATTLLFVTAIHVFTVHFIKDIRISHFVQDPVRTVRYGLGLVLLICFLGEHHALTGIKVKDCVYVDGQAGLRAMTSFDEQLLDVFQIIEYKLPTFIMIIMCLAIVAIQSIHYFSHTQHHMDQRQSLSISHHYQVPLSQHTPMSTAHAFSTPPSCSCNRSILRDASMESVKSRQMSMPSISMRHQSIPSISMRAQSITERRTSNQSPDLSHLSTLLYLMLALIFANLFNGVFLGGWTSEPLPIDPLIDEQATMLVDIGDAIIALCASIKFFIFYFKYRDFRLYFGRGDYPVCEEPMPLEELHEPEQARMPPTVPARQSITPNISDSNIRFPYVSDELYV